MKNLMAVDIFATGKWNGDVYTEKDLDQMVEAFEGAGIKPPLKLGHDEAQKWFGQSDGAPALGWVDRLYRTGKKLLADITGVPDVVASLINQGNYKNKSAEIYWNYETEGKKWPRALKAVSLLGADMPAVSSLEDLQKVLLESKASFVSYANEGKNVRTYSYGGNMEGELEKKYKDDLVAKDVLLASKDASIADLKSGLSKMEERALKAEATLGTLDEKHAIESFTTKVDDLVKAGKCLPAEKDRLIRTFSALGSGVKKFGDKEFNPREDFVKGLDERSVIVSFKEKGKGGEAENQDLPPAVQIDKLVKKVIADKQVSYAKALEVVKEDHPDVWASYVRPTKKED